MENLESPFHLGDWLTGSEKFSSLGVQLYENPFRLDHEPELVGNEYRVKLRVRLNGNALANRELASDYFKKTVSPAIAAADSRLQKELSALKDEPSHMEAQLEEIRKQLVEFIKDSEMKKEMEEKVDLILRLTKLRESDHVRLEERLDRLESEVNELLRQRKVVAFSSGIAEKTV